MKKKTKKQKKNQIQNRIIYSFFQVPNKQKTNKQIRSFIVNGENFPMSAKEIKSLRDERRFHLMNEKEIDKLLLDTDECPASLVAPRTIRYSLCIKNKLKNPISLQSSYLQIHNRL